MERPAFRSSATGSSLLLIALVAAAYPLDPKDGRQSLGGRLLCEDDASPGDGYVENWLQFFIASAGLIHDF